MRNEWHRKTKVEARRVADGRIPGGQIRVHAERRLHIGKGGNDDAPNAFRGVERENALVGLHQPSHHLGFARWSEGRTCLQRLLHFDQTIDDLAALHQQVMHRLIKAIYLLPQSWERIGNRRVSSRPGASRTQPRGIDR